MRALTGTIQSYDAPSTHEIARRVGLPAEEIVRFDGNTSPQALPSTRAEALTVELGRIHTYPHGGYPELERAIAGYAGVEPERSEEHTSELQSRFDLVCRLLLE